MWAFPVQWRSPSKSTLQHPLARRGRSKKNRSADSKNASCLSPYLKPLTWPELFKVVRWVPAGRSPEYLSLSEPDPGETFTRFPICRNLHSGAGLRSLLPVDGAKSPCSGSNVYSNHRPPGFYHESN